MWRPLRGLLLLAGAALIVASCTEPTSAPLHAFVGTFVLRSIDGQAVPVLEMSGTAYRVTLVADTIVSDGRGHFTRRDVVELDSLTGSHQDIASTVDSGSYVVRSDTIEFPHPCPRNAFCTPPPFAVLEPTGDLLFVQSAFLMEGWRYAHVR